MVRSRHDKRNDVGNVFGLQGLEAFINTGGTLGIPLKPHLAELCIDSTRIDSTYADTVLVQVHAHALVQRVNRVLCSAVHITVGVNLFAGYRTYVDDVAASSFHHP